MTTNIPVTTSADSSVEVKQFFDKFFVNKLSFPADQIDSVIAFFTSRGFDNTSANSTGIVLLNQARIDNVNVFQLIDTLKGLNDVQLSQIVAEVLNAYREKSSLLGYRVAPLVDTYEARNILI